MKYQTIQESIKRRIINQELLAGDQVPSIRRLAQQFSVSKTTVIKALAALESEHLIYSIPQKGFFVTENSFEPAKPSQKIDFLTAGPDLSFFSFANLAHCYNQIIANHPKEILSYGEPTGLLSLRQQVQRYLQTQQVFTSLDRLIITSGAQQAVNILLNMPFPNGRENILVEQPTYSGILHAAKLTNRKILGIDISNDEIDFKRLESIFKNDEIKFFYLMSRFQNPLGHSYSKKEKQKLLNLAEKYDVYLVEDDYLGDIDQISKRDPLFSDSPNGRVIYLKSFSKIFLPSLRIAAIVVPEVLIPAFLEYKSYLDSYTSTLSQATLATFMENGMFTVHLKNIKQLYAKKMSTLLDVADRYLPNGATINHPQTGFYTSIKLPRGVNSTILTQQLAQKNILVDDVSRMFLPLQKNISLLRLSISQVDQSQIETGIKTIGQTISDYDSNINPTFWGFHM